ncbi:MAG: DUF3037 domain-containing protein [Acidobacteria bacterium]|nr:DUF3037 domain-containing protein [Acidobacteriota bacterium]
MNQRSDFAKYYYSILQYVPNLERAEGVNVGVVLICPEEGFLKAKTSDDNDRVLRFFGDRLDLDLQRLTALKRAFEERIKMEAGMIKTLEDFEQFIATRANHLRLTKPRPIKISGAEAEAELGSLFASLVEERGHAKAEIEEPAFA